MKNICKKHLPIIIVFLISLTLACSLFSTPAATPEATQISPAAGPTPTSTMDIEENTESPSEVSPKTTPAASLHPSGPWLLLRTVDSLYAVNPDGTGPVLLADTSSWVSAMGLSEMVSPAGKQIAFLTSDNPIVPAFLTLPNCVLKY